jgi:GDP-D-mannose 3', 5'-epimerase
MLRILVTGAGGFIGGHLLPRLREEYANSELVALDLKPLSQWLQLHDFASNRRVKISRSTAITVLSGYDIVFHLASDMGGMPYISRNHFAHVQDVDSTRRLLRAGIDGTVGRIVFASSACVYPATLQGKEPTALLEELAMTGPPDTGYGWAKLYCEQLSEYARGEHSISIGIARLFNVYGPNCDISGPRAKAPAAICRKVLQAHRKNEQILELFGTGTERRSFLHIDDCLVGLLALAKNDVSVPVNMASLECIAIADLVSIVSKHYGYMGDVAFNGLYSGVHSRIPDICRADGLLGWRPQVALAQGMATLAEYIQTCQ